jgi:hypothetical protein
VKLSEFNNTDNPALVQGTAVSAIVGVAVAVIYALNTFGVEVTDDQRNAIVGVIVALFVAAPFVAAVLIRGRVRPVEKSTAKKPPKGK